MSHDDFDEELAPPSKSARKREMLALQAIGDRLVKLKDGELARIPIADDNLAEAVATARRISSHEGRRRQLQYIGKLMRKIDTQEIETALADLERGQKELAKQFHRLEALRDAVAESGAEAIEDIVAAYPDAERQRLRQFALQIGKERAANKPPAASRKLFKYLRELHEAEQD